jgi:hypothetical protein
VLRRLSTLLSAASLALLALTVAGMVTGGFGRVAVARVVSDHWPGDDDEMARESVRGVVLYGSPVVVGGSDWAIAGSWDEAFVGAPPRAPVRTTVRWVTAAEPTWPNCAIWDQPDRWWLGSDHFGISQGGRVYGLELWQVPLWPVALALGVQPSIRLVRWLRQGRRRPAGCCQACGYDLRATPEPGGTLLGRCPECGAVPADTAHRSDAAVRPRSPVPRPSGAPASGPAVPGPVDGRAS